MNTDDPIAGVRARRDRPPTVAVCGHDGAGRATLAAAVRARFRVAATVAAPSGPRGSDTDLVIRVIGAAVRRVDREFLEHTSTPVIVVAGKADARTDPEALAAAAAQELGCEVFPVAARLASAPVGPTDLAAVREGRSTDGLLDRLGPVGLRLIEELVAQTPTATARDAADRLAAASGIDRLAGPIRAAAPAIAATRDLAMTRALRLLGARGISRDRVEDLLAGATG